MTTSSLEAMITSSDLHDEILWRLSQQGESRLISILQLNASEDNSVAIYMDGDCDTADSDRRILVAETGPSGLQVRQTYPYSNTGLETALRQHYTIQRELDITTYTERLSLLASEDSKGIDNNGLRNEISCIGCIEIELKGRYPIAFQADEVPDRHAATIQDLSLTYDDGSDNYQGFSSDDETLELIDLAIEPSSQAGGSHKITRLVLRIYPCELSERASCTADDLEEDFIDLHRSASRHLDEVSSVRFSLVSDTVCVQGIQSGTDSFTIQALGTFAADSDEDDEDDGCWMEDD
jgi:hypothetical protein